MMRRILFVFISIIISVQCLAVTFHNETLHYVISYKWGLIHKDAGDATLSLRQRGQHYDLMLAGKTRPWADKIYMTRDTLLGTINKADLSPVSYTKITHEKDHHDRTEISYTRFRGVTKGETVKYKTRNGKTTVKRHKITGTGPVFDMLSIFYYLRTLDYDRLTEKHYVYKATVFSGSRSETVTIRCEGRKKIKLRNKQTREAFHIRFKFTTGGGTKSSDDIDAWISTDSRHIPLYLVGKLPVGEVRAYYVN